VTAVAATPATATVTHLIDNMLIFSLSHHIIAVTVSLYKTVPVVVASPSQQKGSQLIVDSSIISVAASVTQQTAGWLLLCKLFLDAANLFLALSCYTSICIANTIMPQLRTVNKFVLL